MPAYPIEHYYYHADGFSAWWKNAQEGEYDVANDFDHLCCVDESDQIMLGISYNNEFIELIHKSKQEMDIIYQGKIKHLIVRRRVTNYLTLEYEYFIRKDYKEEIMVQLFKEKVLL